MIENIISQRYAKALIECIEKPNELERASDELSFFSTVLENNPILRYVFENRSVHTAKKTELFEELATRAGMATYVKNFIVLLIRKQRLGFLKNIIVKFKQLCDERLGKAVAVVTTPIELRQEQEHQLSKRFCDLLNKKEVVIQQQVEPDMLGGIIVRIGNMVYDGSIETQLVRLREHLLSE